MGAQLNRRSTSTTDAVSPELVLVDPVLAAEERARLPDLGARATPATTELAWRVDEDALRALADAAPHPREHDKPRRATERSWRPLAVVAAATVLGLLLLDVRVEVGRTPASAGSGGEQAPSSITSSRQPPTSIPSPIPQSPPRESSKPVDKKTTARPVLRRFAWAPVAGAERYQFELFRGPVRVFSASSPGPQLVVPARWTDGGKRRSLVPGEYQWYVWPVIAGRRTTAAVVQATLVVS